MYLACQLEKWIQIWNLWFKLSSVYTEEIERELQQWVFQQDSNLKTNASAMKNIPG